MSYKSPGIIDNPTKRPVYEGAPALDSKPFRIYSFAPLDETVDIRISRYSNVILSPGVKDRLYVIGLDLKINIEYGDKVWLEVFYDKNLEAVFGIISSGPKWLAKTVNTASISTLTDVYPNELEFISKYDLTNKIAEINLVKNSITAMQNSAIEEVTYQKNVGIISQEQFTDFVTAINNGYGDAQERVDEYKSAMNAFFTGSPTATWKKLFRTYTMIGYTTRDMAANLGGIAVFPPPQVPSTTPVVPTASEQVPYQIVQCVNTDLYLADISFENRYPAKLPMPYHRPVYPFIVEGKNEDTLNTQ